MSDYSGPESDLNYSQSLRHYAAVNQHLWGDSYFADRDMNNARRLAQFRIDADFVRKFFKGGNVCDVGCSSGEFLRFASLDGTYFGMEVNPLAMRKASDIISFDKNILTEEDFFDLVIFRGTIQHVDIPFQMIKSAYHSLKPGGVIVFLATPNSNSILYRLKQELPFVNWRLNFYIPGKKDLSNALENFGFNVIGVEYPYWKTPYRRIVFDHFKFLLNVFSPKFHKHAFWGSSMNLAAQKV